MMNAHRLGLGLILVSALALCACQGGGLSNLSRANGGTAGTGEVVNLSATDLAEVDQYFDSGAQGENTRWILGDQVDVVASKEYFSRLLSFNRGPFVSRTERADGDTAVVTLRFMGAPNQASVQNNPRVQIGTGLTVSAAKEIRIRMVPTTNSAMPVRLNVVARGKAMRGHREEVLQRGEMITTGGNLVQRAGRWTWVPTGG